MNGRIGDTYQLAPPSGLGRFSPIQTLYVDDRRAVQSGHHQQCRQSGQRIPAHSVSIASIRIRALDESDGEIQLRESYRKLLVCLVLETDLHVTLPKPTRPQPVEVGAPARSNDWRARGHRVALRTHRLRQGAVFIERQHTFTSGFIHRSEIFRLTIKRPKMGKMLCNLRL